MEFKAKHFESTTHYSYIIYTYFVIRFERKLRCFRPKKDKNFIFFPHLFYFRNLIIIICGVYEKYVLTMCTALLRKSYISKWSNQFAREWANWEISTELRIFFYDFHFHTSTQWVPTRALNECHSLSICVVIYMITNTSI